MQVAFIKMNFLALCGLRPPQSSEDCPPNYPPHVAVAANWDDLARIKDPAINLAIYPRPLPASLTDWLDRLPFEQLPDGRVILEEHEEHRIVEALVNSNLQTVTPESVFFISDILENVAAFRHLSGYKTLQLRLERIDHPACKKFHTDNVGLRLLVTYRGVGTEWLPDYAVDRSALGCCEHHSLCKNFRAVQQLPRGHIGLFKGSAYAPGVTDGIVHRSPPVAGRKQSRLLLCLDKPYC